MTGSSRGTSRPLSTRSTTLPCWGGCVDASATTAYWLWVKAFLKAGIRTEDGLLEDSTAGTPQGGILSPLLANAALSVLDEHIAGIPGGPATGKAERAKRLRHGLPNFRLVRYADDCA
jgi:retron-type reverse transcriptase